MLFIWHIILWALQKRQMSEGFHTVFVGHARVFRSSIGVEQLRASTTKVFNSVSYDYVPLSESLNCYRSKLKNLMAPF